MAAANRAGSASRARFKLEQLDRRFNLLRSGQRVLELGAAPGGWSGYVDERIGAGGRLIAVDERPVAVSERVLVIVGAVGEEQTDKLLADILDEDKVDLVLSDMSPNISGIRAADQARAMALAELAERCADRWLKPGGALVVKVFQGADLEEWIRRIRSKYGRFKQVKPDASRAESREMYAVAQQYRSGG